MKRRSLIRIFSFSAVAAAIFLARSLIWQHRASDALGALENGYVRALEELSTSADNIANTLQKELYAGTPDMHLKLSQQLWRDSSAAKAALSQLPTDKLPLENTNKFLSQVGNYSLSVSEKLRSGGSLAAKEYENLEALLRFSRRLQNEMWQLEDKVSSGSLSFTKAAPAKDDTSAPSVTEGFTDFEEGFDSYPTLIYDGPFSDHIMQKEPLMTRGKPEISRETALERASLAMQTDQTALTSAYEEGGKMPSYVFASGDGSACCAVTKQGGYISYFLKSRLVPTENLPPAEALAAGDACLERLGLNNMQRTYSENIDHIMTVNYACRQDKVCCYTDLIKISVAMDSGEIIGFDARGYLVNHHRRDLSKKRISVLDAAKKLSPKLTEQSRGLALIPGEGQEELLCYEFKCETSDGTHVIVYFNAYTGKEEQILILFESESGTLAM